MGALHVYAHGAPGAQYRVAHWTNKLKVLLDMFLQVVEVKGVLPRDDLATLNALKAIFQLDTRLPSNQVSNEP